MQRVTIFGCALFAIATAIGTAVDPVVERPEVVRLGMRVLEVDLHVHTRFSDGFLSPFDVVWHARRNGLDAIAITEHNQVFPAKLGRAYADWLRPRVGAPVVLVGEEVTTKRYHLLAIGIERRIDARQPIEHVIDEVRAQGGIAVAAHPTERFWSGFEPVRDRLDAVEVVHPIAHRGGGRQWSYDQIVAFWDGLLAEGRTPTAIGTSDYHFGSGLGLGRTYVFVDPARAESAEAILEAFRKGQTATIAPDGRVFGEPALVEALQADPPPQRDVDFRYRPRGVLDLIGRLLGTAALALLVGFRRRGPKTALLGPSPSSVAESSAAESSVAKQVEPQGKGEQDADRDDDA